MRNATAIAGLGLLLVLHADARAANWHEDFATDPAARGWSVRGDASLFAWDAAGQRLAATWDSTRTNTFFFRPLGTVLARTDSFRFAFRLEVTEAYGLGSGGTFQLALGLLRRDDAFRTNFFRGSGVNPATGPRDVVEFNYFPASGTIAPTFAAVAVGTNNLHWAMVNLFPFELTPGDRFEISVAFQAQDQSLALSVSREGLPYSSGVTRIDSRFTDFRVDAFSITSYSGAGQPAGYAGDILARGWIDDLEVEFPDPPQPRVAIIGPGLPAGARTPIVPTWKPTLERAADSAPNRWEEVASELSIEGTDWVLADPQSPPSAGLYRVRLDRP